VSSRADSEKSQIHGTTGSGNVLPISALTQENSTSLLFTRQGRENFATTVDPSDGQVKVTHPRMVLTSFTYDAGKPRQLPLLCGLTDVVAQTGFLLTADFSNTVNIMIGGPNVSATNGIPMVAGQSMFLDIVRLSKIYAIAQADHSGGVANIFWLDM